MDNPTSSNAERAAAWFEIIRQAARDFGFREPPMSTTPAGAEAYLRELHHHVEQRDFARAFELRVGVKQAEWSADQVKAFKDFMLSHPHRDVERDLKPPSYYRFEQLKLDPPIDLGRLRDFVDATIDMQVARRTRFPDDTLPIIVAGLLTTGKLLTALVERSDRVPAITSMARNYPLFGWLVAADMFVHHVDTASGKASKVDCIGVHFGTREVRGFLTKNYKVVAGVVTWEPVTDFFNREGGVKGTEDPYAFVFQPPTRSKPS